MWFVAGVGLLIFELVTPGGLFAIFFGFAAIVVGLLLVAVEWSAHRRARVLPTGTPSG